MFFYEELLEQHEPLVREIIKFFLSPLVDQKLHKNIKEKCSNRENLEDIFNHDSILKLNGLFKEDFILYMNLINKYQAIHVPSLELTLNLLIKNDLIVDFNIEVENLQGDLSLGTGFLYFSKNVIVTSKHIIDNHRITKICDEQGHSFDFNPSKIKLSNNDDIALIWLKEESFKEKGIIPYHAGIPAFLVQQFYRSQIGVPMFRLI